MLNAKGLIGSVIPPIYGGSEGGEREGHREFVSRNRCDLHTQLYGRAASGCPWVTQTQARTRAAPTTSAVPPVWLR